MRVLVVETHAGLREEMAALLQGQGFEVITVASAALARAVLGAAACAAIIISAYLPDNNTMPLVHYARLYGQVVLNFGLLSRLVQVRGRRLVTFLPPMPTAMVPKVLGDFLNGKADLYEMRPFTRAA